MTNVLSCQQSYNPLWVCHTVGVEPILQPLTGEQLSYRSANIEDGARLDVVAERFWDH